MHRSNLNLNLKLKWAWLLLGIRVGQATPVDQQLDQVRPIRDIEFLAGDMILQTMPQRMSRLVSEVGSSADSPVPNVFRIKDVQCDKLGDEDICIKIRAAYLLATARLSNILDLLRPIELQVVWKDMCPNDPNCTRSTLGQASPSAFWSVDTLVATEGAPDLDPKYMYPQSVVKQYTNNLNFTPYDIIIEHDSKQRDRMWFKGDQPIGDEQYEFEYLEKNKEALLPPLKIDATTGAVEGIKRPFIFDKYLAYGFVPEASIDHWVHVMTEVSYRLKGLQRAAWEDAFLKSAGGRLAKELYNVATSPQSLFFLVGIPGATATNRPLSLQARSDMIAELEDPGSSGIKSTGDQQEENKVSQTKITLHTPTQFISGSSVSHLDLQLYQDTADFLMRPVASYGQVLYAVNIPTNSTEPEFIGEDGSFPPVGLIKGSFGPALVNVLVSLGYKVKANLTQFADAKARSTPKPTSAATLVSPALAHFLFILVSLV